MTTHTLGVNAFAVCLTCKKLHTHYTMYGADESNICIVDGHNVVILETDRDYSRLGDYDVRKLMTDKSDKLKVI